MSPRSHDRKENPYRRNQALKAALSFMRRSTVFLLLLFAPAAWARTFHGCPDAGRGGDTALNRLKNRTTAPGSAAARLLSDILHSHPVAEAMGKRDRATWTSDALALTLGKRSRHASRVGSSRSAPPGPRRAIAGHPEDVDWHVWIAARPSRNAKPHSSMVVEVSPRVQRWEHDKFVALAKLGTRVRISGWMLWDEEHGSEVGKSRGTLWEIHPVHQIKVYRNGGWELW